MDYLPLLNLAFALISAALARRLNKSVVPWFLLALLLGPLAALLLLLTGRSATCPQCGESVERGGVCSTCGDAATDPPPFSSDPGCSAECPHCGLPYRPEDYSAEAERILCRACKEELPRATAEEAQSMKSGAIRWLILALTCLLLGGCYHAWSAKEIGDAVKRAAQVPEPTPACYFSCQLECLTEEEFHQRPKTWFYETCCSELGYDCLEAPDLFDDE